MAGDRRENADPPLLFEDYLATRTRAPKEPLVIVPQTLSELSGPVYGDTRVGELDHDLTRQHEGEPQGERIILHGRVLDGDGQPVPHSLIEVWQANAAGRYQHVVDRHPAPWTRTSPAPGGRRLRGPLPVHHDQARRLPVAQPRQRVARGAHPPVAVRPRVRHPAGDPDVLPG